MYKEVHTLTTKTRKDRVRLHISRTNVRDAIFELGDVLMRATSTLELWFLAIVDDGRLPDSTSSRRPRMSQ